MQASLLAQVKYRYLAGVLALVMSLSSLSYAEPTTSEPHRLVETTTNQVLDLLKTGLDPVKAPDEFVQKLSAILDPVIAFEYIAKGVLGVHAKNASPEQVSEFAESFKKGLVNTYGRGISGFGGLDIQVIPPAKPIGESRRATVVQEIKTSSGTTKVAYSMAKNRQGQWKMINLILNGINFGQTFRGQFAAAVERNKGDLDKTIKQWENGVE